MYYFLKERCSDTETVFAVAKESFKYLPLAETYDRYGQLVGHENAGDYHPDNPYSDFTEGDDPVLTMCEAYNYWDGNNWRSIVISVSEGCDDAITYEIVKDKTKRQKFLRAIREKKQISDSGAHTTYRYADLILVKSRYADAFEDLKIVDKDAYFHSIY